LKSQIRKINLIRLNQTKFGGAENYLLRLSKQMTESKFNHQIINSSIPRFLPSWVRVMFFNMAVCFFKKDKFYFSLDRILCPDIYRAGDGVHKVFLSKLKKKSLNPLHPIYLFIERKCLRKAKCVIANSKMIKRQIIEAYDIEPEKIRVIYNGIEIKEINYEKSFANISKEFNINKSTTNIIFVGSGFERKGVKELLYIASNINSNNIKVFVIGKEKNISLYQNLSRELGVQDKVIFTGPREDVDDFYTIGDIFLFPTHYEPFSNVVLEAMNFENVVFTTAQNGASEILDKEFIMDHANDYSVSEKINNLLRNSEKLEFEKKKNRKKSIQFSIKRNLEETIEQIRSFL